MHFNPAFTAISATFASLLLYSMAIAEVKSSDLAKATAGGAHDGEDSAGPSCGCSSGGHGPLAHGPVPASIMGAHTHKAGSWMVGYRYMYQGMKDINPADSHQEEEHHGEEHGHDDHGTDHEEMAAATSKHGDVGAPSAPHSHEMSMQMHMIDMMYGVTDSVTAMVMVPFHQMEMKHNVTDMVHKTRSEGLGDINLAALISAYRSDEHQLIVSPGISLPTGEIDDTDEYHGVSRKHPYHMKLGSGTVDLTPAVTYQYSKTGWNLGVQGSGVIRLGENDEDFALGNRAKVTTWAGASLGEGFGSTFRISGEAWRDVRGTERDQAISSALFDPNQQAGYLIDAGLGVVYSGSGALDGQSFGIEFSAPLAQDADDGVHEMKWGVTASWAVSF